MQDFDNDNEELDSPVELMVDYAGQGHYVLYELPNEWDEPQPVGRAESAMTCLNYVQDNYTLENFVHIAPCVEEILRWETVEALKKITQALNNLPEDGTIGDVMKE